MNIPVKPESTTARRMILISEEEYEQVIKSNSGDPDAFGSSASQPKKEARWLNQEQAEALLGRNTTSLWRYVKTGLVHVRKRMGRNYYDRNELKTLLPELSEEQ